MLGGTTRRGSEASANERTDGPACRRPARGGSRPPETRPAPRSRGSARSGGSPVECVCMMCVVVCGWVNDRTQGGRQAGTHLEGLVEALARLADRLERRGAVEVVHAADQVRETRVQAAPCWWWWGVGGWGLVSTHGRQHPRSAHTHMPHASATPRVGTDLASSCSARSMLLDMRFTCPRHVAAERPRCVPRLKPSASAMHRCSCSARW